MYPAVLAASLIWINPATQPAVTPPLPAAVQQAIDEFTPLWKPTGRDLVVVKSAVVNAAFAVDHNWDINRKGQSSKYHYSDSFRAGNDVGGRVNLNKSIAP